VALAMAGLLLAGLVQVFVASLESWNRVNRALAARRSVEGALARMAADLERAGYLLPLPGRTLPDLPGDPGWPGPWRLVPARPDSRGPGFPELTLVYDRPLAGALDLAEAIPAPPEDTREPAWTGPASVQVRAPRTFRLRAGDLLLAPGGRFGWAVVAARTELARGRTEALPLAPDRGRITGSHPAGTPLAVVRPGRLVRYAVVPLGPGAAAAAGGCPSLVRFEAACAGSGREPRWPEGLGSGVRSAGVRHQVLARGVTGFRVAFTPASGRPAGWFQVDLAVAGPGPDARAAGTRRVALRNGGPP